MTLEDHAIREGITDFDRLPCEICGQLTRLFGLEYRLGQFVCGHCITDGERLLNHDRELVEAEATAETWEGAKGDVIRAERNRLLAYYQWAVMPGSPLTPVCQDNFTKYFTALNCLTVHFATPDEVVWPNVPSLDYQAI